MTAPAQVLFVCLDSADKDLILRWAGEGLLPTFQRLIDTSRWGITLAPLGMHAAAVWHSLSTAVSPARHGHYGERQIRPGTYDMYRFWPTDVKWEPFWNALSRAGRRVAIIDAPYVPLSQAINGLHILDWTPHATDTGFCTAPPDLAAEVRTRFGTDPIGLCDRKHLAQVTELRGFRDALVARVEMKTALSRHFLEQGGWDLFLTTFGEAHCIGHQCWHLNDPGHPRHDSAVARAVGNPMQDVYRALDAAVGQLLALASPQATVFVLATHGMGPYYNGAHLLVEILTRLGHTPPPRPPRRAWTALRWSWRRLPEGLQRRWAPLQKAVVDLFWPPLDSRCACFDVPNGEVYGAIRVNLVGREPRGRIRPGAELDAFCEELRRDLCALINVETGKPAVRNVLRTADLYQGPHLDELPDLLIEWNSEAPLTEVHSPKTGTVRRAFEGLRSGHHLREGVFFALGPGIQPGQLADPVSIMDFAPTIASILGVALPNVDGRPIGACIGPVS